MSSTQVSVPVRRITPNDGMQYFFGYYDTRAWSPNGEEHLCHRVKFMDRRPEPGDVAELGLLRVSDGTFTLLAETTAWNFQQGSLLQWHPAAPDREVIYNRREGGRFVGILHDLKTHKERVFSKPLACISPTGRHALSTNFSRMFDFRPGYGYAGLPDAFAAISQPQEDGVFLVDLTTGESRLVLSLAAIGALDSVTTNGQKLLINHMTFNSDGTRFMCLPRNFPKAKQSWLTGLVSADIDGRNAYQWGAYGLYSHYHWRDPQNLAVFARVNGKEGLYLLKDRTQERTLIDGAFFLYDGHCSYSPDRRWMLYDSYPRGGGFRSLFLYDLQKKCGVTLGQFYGPNPNDVDIRCDLHPRWSPSGRSISFDSIHEGRRHIYVADLSQIVS